MPQGVRAYRDQTRLGLRYDVCTADAAVAADHGHFTKAITRAQDAKRGAAFGDTQFALSNETKELAGFAIFHNYRTGGSTVPSGKAHDFPYLHVVEIRKKRQGAQALKLVAVGHFFHVHCNLLVAERLRQIVRELLPT